MSVLIEGMDMPKSCRECPCSSWEGSAEKPRTFCHATKDHKETTNGRDACPLVEVPKHGRLIDADELEKFELPATLFPEGRESNIDVWTHAVAIGDIKNAPTVIEAEVTP